MTEKISIVTDEISQDPMVVAEFLEKHDVKAVEIRTMGGNRVPDIDVSMWEDFKTRCKNEGWGILGLSPGTFKGEYRDEERIGHELEVVLPDTIGLAIEVGAEFVITFGFMAPRDIEVPGYIQGAIERAAELCHAAGLKLLIENEPGSFADTGERTRDLINNVGHPNLYANWDPCNAGIFNDPHRLALSARSLGDRIAHVHVKDGIPKPDGGHYPDYSLISNGQLGWKEHLMVLREMDYSGWFGIETHFEPMIENSAIVLSEFRTLLNDVNYEGRFHGT